jgi:hypothetical protein
MMHVLLCAALVAVQTPTPSAESNGPQRTLVRAARMLDVTTGKLVEHPEIEIDGRRIVAVRTAEGPWASTMRMIDLGDVTILPGLIDGPPPDTLTCVVTVLVSPSVSVTVRRTSYSPGAGNDLVGAGPCACSPSPKVHCQVSTAAGSCTLALKSTTSGAGPPVALASTVTIGGVAPGARRNQGIVVGSVLKNASSWSATLVSPLVEGCVKSATTSAHSQVKPSLRGTLPSAHK